MSTVRDIAERLAAKGLGTIAGSGPEPTIFPGRRPDSPDRMLSVQSYPGDPPRLLDGDNLPADERVAFQITARVARGSGQGAAEVLADQAFRALVGRHLTINGRTYHWIRANHLPASIGVDENDRPLVVVNMTARRRGTF